jgi:hypothetical protein
MDGRPFKKQKLTCGPARSNDNFDIFNCYFAYKSTYKRIELFTKASMMEGFYEALTNYDTPGRAPCYFDSAGDSAPESTGVGSKISSFKSVIFLCAASLSADVLIFMLTSVGCMSYFELIYMRSVLNTH